MLEVLRGTLQQNLHPPFENYVLARVVDWNGWSGRRLVGTRKAKVKYIGPSPDPKEESRQDLQARYGGASGVVNEKHYERGRRG